MKDFWFFFRANRGALAGLIVVLSFLLVALLAPVVAPYYPTDLFSNSLKVPPVWAAGGQSAFVLGTDDLGRDLLSRLVYGARVSIGIGFFVVVFSMSVGVFLGLLAGSLGGIVDSIIMRTMDVLMSLPSILLAVVVVAVLGPGLTNTIIAVGIVAIPNFVRLVRATVVSEMKKNYVVASRTYGAGWFRIVLVNVLPNCFAPIIVQGTLGFSEGILSAAALGFLGLGAQPPTPEWGTMLSDSRSYIESAPWLVTYPGVCILVVVFAFNLLGDGLRDAFDPKLRR
jgi:dipeptide transport system permease protein